MWENKAVQLVSKISSGVQPHPSRSISVNRDYFAYSAVLSVYIVNPIDYRTVNMINEPNNLVSTISLCKNNTKVIAIAYVESHVLIINFVTNCIIDRVLTEEKLVSLCWTENKGLLVGYSKQYDRVFIYSPDTPGIFIKKTGVFANIRNITSFYNNADCVIGGNNTGYFSVYDIEAHRHKSVSHNGKICSVDIDPNSSSSCLCVWSTGVWTVYDLSNGILSMSENNKFITPICTGVWCHNPPGHFVTGDTHNGIIRMWNPSSEDPIENIPMHNVGFIFIKRHPTNHSSYICGFLDGMISVFDYSTKSTTWKTSPGHQNTIFKLHFLPSNPDIMFSCGAEGSICSWDTSDFFQIEKIAAIKLFSYVISMAISPGGGFLICGNANGRIGVLSLKTMDLIFEEKLVNSKIASIEVAPFNPNVIMIVATEKRVLLYDLGSRSILINYGSVDEEVKCGCFSPSEQSTIALINQSNILSIIKNNETIKSIQLPQNEYFSLVWCPHSPDILAASTNNGNAVVIYTSASPCEVICFFTHNGPSRPVLFHPVFDNVVASSGYDGIICLYDFKAKKEIYSFHGHSSHIYGLCFSPKNPFLLASSGSDTTIRFWSIDRPFIDLVISESLRGNFLPLRPMIGNQHLVKLLKRMSSPSVVMNFRLDEPFHIADATRIASKSIKSIASPTGKDAFLNRNALKSKERLMNAAKIALKSGDIKQYCEFMYSAGEKLKALSFASSVSFEFWQLLMKEYIDSANEENDYQYLYAANQSERVIHKVYNENGGNNALLISSVVEQGKLYNVGVSQNRKKKPINDNNDYFSASTSYLENFITFKNCNFHNQNGHTYLSACSYLSIGDVKSAIKFLLNNGELIAAFQVEMLLFGKLELSEIAFGRLCIAHGFSEQLYPILSQNSKYILAPVLLFSSDKRKQDFLSQQNITRFHNDSIDSKANSIYRIHDALVFESVERGIEQGIELFKSEISNQAWDWQYLKDIIFELCLPDLKSLSKELQNTIILLNLIVVSYESYWKGFRKAYERCISLMKEHETHKHSWIQSVFAQIESLSLSFPPMPLVPIKVYGGNFLNEIPLGFSYNETLKYGPLIRLDDLKTDITLEEMIQWNSMTILSPIGKAQKYLIF